MLSLHDSAFCAASTSPWLLSSACTLVRSPLTSQQGRELARRLSLLLPERPELQPLLLELCRRFGLLEELQEAQLLPFMHAAEQIVVAGSEPLRATIDIGRLLALLAHPSAAVREQAARLISGHLRVPDASRAAILGGLLVGENRPAASAALLPCTAERSSTAPELAPPPEAGLPEGLAPCVLPATNRSTSSIRRG